MFAAIDRWALLELRRWLWYRIRDPRRKARVLIKRGLLAETARTLATGAPCPEIAIESKAFRSAYPVQWLQKQGWVSCRESVRSRVCLGSGTARIGHDEFAAGPEADLESDCRIAARDCELYEWDWMLAAR